MATSDVSRLEDSDWINILNLIKKGKCTSFIGAGTKSVHCPWVGILQINGPRIIIIL